MPFFITLGKDNEQDKRLQKLQQTRIARIKEMRRIDQERRHEMMKWYQQEARQQQNDLKEYYTRCRQAEEQGQLLRKALEEQAWANIPNSQDEAECVQNEAKENALKKRQLAALRKMSQNQRAQQAFDIIANQRAEESAQKAQKVEKYQKFQVKENARRQKVIDEQKFREREKKKYFLEEQLYKESLEYKLREKQGAVYTEVVKEDKIPLMVNKNCQRPIVQIIPERVNDNPNMSGLYSADAYVEAANQAQNPNVKVYPQFDYNKYNRKQRVDSLAAEGLTILEAISKM